MEDDASQESKITPNEEQEKQLWQSAGTARCIINKKSKTD
ncbi:helix-turn-helix domain-containing protein [Enterococcus villorum]|nr:helix-turn-helix domain-containing protein [Enterococcus villorum]